MVEEFSDFAGRASFSHYELGFQGGVIWHSTRLRGAAGSYESPLPAGLHISCGIARIQSHSKDCGGFESDGPSVSILHVPPGGTSFSTRMYAGAVQSFGFYLPDQALAENDPILKTLNDAARDRPLVTIPGPILRSVARLSARLNETEDQDVQHALLKARVLELTGRIAAEVRAPKVSQHTRGVRLAANLVRDHIEANLRASLQLDEIASATGLGVRTMTAAFRKRFDETIAGYIRRRRMEVAAALLEQGASVSEAAFIVGYTPNGSCQRKPPCPAGLNRSNHSG